jgi:hypothetical protein
MKIIQSFWSGGDKNFKNNYGWYSYKYNWLSWILSCHQLVKFHDEVELYTDQFGYEILIEKLQLPYTKVHVVLDKINNYPKDLWAIAKVKTFQMQKDPFIHVDGDVFVWESLTEKFMDSGLITQNVEITTKYYRKHWDLIYPYLIFLPDEIQKFHDGRSNFACNMGIIGGNNLDFFKNYCEKSIEFVDKNRDVWEKINDQYFNLFFEQVLFYQYANQENQTIDFLFPEMPKDNEYIGFGDFDKVPQKTYLHLLGVYKKEISICISMEIYIMKYYPEEYSNFARLINEINQDKEHIDYLSQEKVEGLILDFDKNLKANILSTENFLLKRDLYNEGSPIQFETFLISNKEFIIVLLSGFNIKNDEVDNNVNFLEIDSLNNESIVYEIDQIDEIMLHELSNPIKYFSFIEKMYEYFEDEGEDSNEEFLSLINNRLRNYLILKTISIYSFN